MELSESVKIRVRFSEVDSIKMVWHGSYVAYLEDAREAFGRKYGLEYKTILKNMSYAPIVDLNLQYKQMVSVDDELIVKIFLYRLRAEKFALSMRYIMLKTMRLCLLLLLFNYLLI